MIQNKKKTILWLPKCLLVLSTMTALMLSTMTAFLLCSCGKNSQPVPQPVLQPVPTMQEHQEEKKLGESIVRVEGNGYVGSGVIWSVDDEKIVILSCRHVLDRETSCHIIFANGESYCANISFLSERYDYGFATISTDAMDSESFLALQAVEKSQRTQEQIIKGEEIQVYGSSDYVASDCIKGYVVEADILVDIAELYAEQSMMVCYGQISSGMSGGGVFDESGALIGILSGGDMEQQQSTEAQEEPLFVVVPIWHIT